MASYLTVCRTPQLIDWPADCFFQVGFQIKTRVQELGHGCIYLVQKAGALQVSPTDSFSKRELIECARAVTEKVGQSTRDCYSTCCSLLSVCVCVGRTLYPPNLRSQSFVVCVCTDRRNVGVYIVEVKGQLLKVSSQGKSL